jgi:hypothetical protein
MWHKKDHKPTRDKSSMTPGLPDSSVPCASSFMPSDLFLGNQFQSWNEVGDPDDGGDDPGNSDNGQGDSSSIHSANSLLLKLGKANEQSAWNEHDMWKIITGMKAQSSILKLSPPSQYNGAADYDRFESWVSEVRNYYEMIKFEKKLIP